MFSNKEILGQTAARQDDSEREVILALVGSAMAMLGAARKKAPQLSGLDLLSAALMAIEARRVEMDDFLKSESTSRRKRGRPEFESLEGECLVIHFE